MSFSNPAAFLWALLAVPIVIFYILKVRMRRVPVSTTMFWEQVFEEKTSRSLWHHLRHLISLLLQLMFLALLVTSLTDPFFSNDIREQRRLIVVLDTSASMQAAETNSGTRFDLARDQVQHMITSLKSRDEMALLVAGNRPEVVCGLTSHQRSLQNRLDAITPTDGPTRVSDAVEIGRRLLADHENGEVVVVTDGCFQDAAMIASDRKVVWSQVGETVSNVGLTRFQVRRSLLDLVGFQILVQVSNFSSQPAECKLDLSFNDELLDVYPLDLAAGEVWTEVFEKTSTDGGVLKAELRFDSEIKTDGLESDNVAAAILPERLRIPVTLVSSGNWFLQRVLEANDAVELTLATDIPKSMPANGVLVLHQKVPQKLPSGKIFVVQPTTSTDLWKTLGKVEQPLVGRQKKDHDLLQHVSLENVMMPEALRISLQSEFTSLVESINGDPLYVHISRPEGDVVVLSVDLDQGDLPLRTAFPIMLTNALTWFADGDGELIEAIPTGTVCQVSLPSELQKRAKDNRRQLILVAPDGSRQPVVVEGDAAAIGPLGQSGLWTLRPPNGKFATEDETIDPSITVACNLMNPQESNLQVDNDIRPRQEAVEAGFGGRPIWFYLIAFAVVLTLTEWFLFQRRWIT